MGPNVSLSITLREVYSFSHRGVFAKHAFTDTGEYQGATFTEMVNFHKGRLRQAFACPSASCIAFVAFETIPRLDEAEAILQALDDLKSEVPRQPPAYLSFVFTPESQSCLPWQGSTPKQALDVIRTHAERPKSWPIAGVGINCTKPTLMSKVVGEFNAAAKSRKLSLFVSVTRY